MWPPPPALTQQYSSHACYGLNGPIGLVRKEGVRGPEAQAHIPPPPLSWPPKPPSVPRGLGARGNGDSQGREGEARPASSTPLKDQDLSGPYPSAGTTGPLPKLSLGTENHPEPISDLGPAGMGCIPNLYCFFNILGERVW